MQLAQGRRRFPVDPAARNAELESLLNSLAGEIDRQRAMVRALAYGAIGTAIIFFLFGLMASTVLS